VLRGKTKVCPVCDSTIDDDARQCPDCNTDLSLFDVDSDGVSDVERTPIPAGKAIDDILASIVKDKEVRPDIFDHMKTIANGTQEEDILADTPGEQGAEFACPDCGARVAEKAQRCPSCGAEFADETVEQFECPLCNAVVDVDATSCPSCGVQFAQEVVAPPAPAKPARSPPPATTAPAEAVDELGLEERPAPTSKPGRSSVMERLWRIAESRRIPPDEALADRGSLYKELPRLVNEVKPLLLIAKKVGVEIGEEKELIGDAITYGKKRDVERAVQLIREAQFRMEETFTSALAKRIESVLVEAERSKQTGGDVGQVETLCVASIEALEKRDYHASADKVHAAKQEFDARSGGYGKARQEYELSKSLVIDARKLGLDLREANTDLRRSESALQARNWDQAALLALQARQSLFKALPGLLNAEMKRARNALLEMKVKGGDLAKPVGILKQASIHIKREEFADALRFVAMFRDTVGSL